MRIEYEKAKVVLQVGKDMVIGVGPDYEAARNDASLTLLQSTSYRFKSKLPENVRRVDNPESLIAGSFPSKPKPKV